MASNLQGTLEVRCFCSHTPLLAMAGRDKTSGALFVHIKSSKGSRLNVEAVVTSGVVRIHCRDCFRWHTVRIVDDNTLQSTQEDLPDSINV